jgi:hypothetical protein
MGVRQTVLGAYEFIIPEDCLATCLSIMGIADEDNDQADRAAFGDSMRMLALRKIFRCKKIPKEIYAEAKTIPHSVEIVGSKRGLSHLITPGVALHVIGIKEDDHRNVYLRIENGKEVPFPEGYYQEML